MWRREEGGRRGWNSQREAVWVEDVQKKVGEKLGKLGCWFSRRTTAKTTVSVRMRRSAPSRNKRKRTASIASGSLTTSSIAIRVSRPGEFGNAGPCWRR